MKVIKNVSMVMLIALLSATIIFAQDGSQRRGPQGPPPPPDPEQVDQIVKDLTWELTLTKEQAEKFETVFRSHVEEMAKKHEARLKKQKEQMEEAMESFEKDLSGILNEAQMEKFRVLRNKEKGMRDNPRNEEHNCRGKHSKPCRK